MPPTCATVSRTQAEIHDPKIVENVASGWLDMTQSPWWTVVTTPRVKVSGIKIF